jgi:hypothetical protein
MSRYYAPQPDELAAAHKAFEASEPRDLFYKAATELIELALQGHTTKLTLVEAIAVLLQTWNRGYYQYHEKFDAQHFAAIERVEGQYHERLMRFRPRAIESFSRQDEDMVREIFDSLERVLGPVGAAKCLHLLAPQFFPLWDRAIAAAYGLALRKKGENADRYCCFVQIAQRQHRELEGRLPDGSNPLKVLDEYNYCRFTKGWI